MKTSARNNVMAGRVALALVAMLLSFPVIIGCNKKATAADQLAAAERHFQAGDYESAEIEYLNLLKTDRKNPAALARLGIIGQRQGQMAKALSVLQAVKSNDLNNVEVRRALALTYVSLHAYDKAREESEFVLQKVPDDSDALFVLVDAAREPDEMEAARQRIESLLRSSGEKSQFYVGLGELAMRQRDLKLAEGHLAKAVALDPQSGPAMAAMANLHFSRTNLVEGERVLKEAAQRSPPRSFVRLKWADFKTGMGQAEEAKQFLEATLKDAPGYVPALSRLARIAFDQKKLDECTALVRRLLTSDPFSFEGRLLSARLNAAQGQSAKAIQELERMAEVFTRNPIVPFELALAHLEARSGDKALDSLRRAVALDPGYAEAVLLLADMYSRRGETAPAIAALTELIKLRPQFITAQYALASAYRLAGTPDNAMPIYRRLMQIKPKDPSPPYSMGLIQRQQKKTAEARQSFEKALEIDPDYLRAVVELVDMDVEARNYTNALLRLEKQIARTPKRAELYFTRGQVYRASQNTELAEQSYLKSIEVNPDYSQSYGALAQLMIASGRQQQAVERLEALLVRNAKDVNALMLLGMLHEQAGNVPRARDAYDRLLAVNPKFARGLNNAANLYAQQLGDLPKGLELARRARAQAPSDPFVADTLGWLLYQTGDYATALALLQESARQMSDEPEVRYHLGMTQYMLGDETQARATLTAAVQTTNSYKGKADAEQNLAMLNIDPARSGPAETSLLDKRLAQRPDDPVAAFRRAAIHARSREPDKALAVAEKALKARPSATRLVVQLAELYSDPKKDRERALEYARQARKLAPEDPQVAYAVGRVAFQNRDHKWAYGVLQDAARKRSDHPDFLTLAGLSAYSVGQLSEAESFLKRAIPLANSTWQTNTIQHLLAMNALLREPARIPAAAGQIEQALKTNPDDVPSLMAGALAHEQKGNLAEAEKSYSRVLEVYPEFVPAMKSLARLYAAQGSNTQRAFDLATKARESLSSDPELTGILGTLVYQRGDFNHALRLLKEATRTRTNDASLYFHMGMAHYRLKEKAPAKGALGRALQLNPTAPFAAEAKKTMTELDGN